MEERPRRLVVGISGATGSRYGIRLLELLRGLPAVETHLIITEPGRRTIREETDYALEAVEALADRVYDNRDIGAPLASGSFSTMGMVILPCSIRTAAALAGSTGDGLLCRAADVTLKEGRPLVVAVREAPLHAGHLRQLLRLAEIGAVIFPPLPAFYLRPRTLDELVDQTVGRILDRVGIPHGLGREWTGSAIPVRRRHDGR
ncbi:MAG: UbiX family flavin prenyltransferase [Candidatus Methylomirabilota bacterium]